MGSSHSSTMDTGAFRVTEAWFPPGSVLESHTHDRGIFAVMIDGSFVTEIAGRRLDCVATAHWTEPIEERHANLVGPRGARVIVSQPNPSRSELLGPLMSVMDSIRCTRDPFIALDAQRIEAEFGIGDSLSPLTIDSLVMLMLARAARGTRHRARALQPWLLRARELLHDCFHQRLDLAAIAHAVGVTPWHLAREFRRAFRTSIGEYARALRLSHALDRLAHTDAPISEIAHRAGFADQSHLTRACKAGTGCSPAAYRRRAQHRSRQPDSQPCPHRAGPDDQGRT